LLNHLIGCTTCANSCPAQAVTFPAKSIEQHIKEFFNEVRGLVRENQLVLFDQRKC